MFGPCESRPSSPAARASRRFPLRLVLFGVVAVQAVFCGFLLPTVAQARDLIQHYGYYGMAVTFAWALLAIGREMPVWWRERAPIARREALSIGGVICGLTLIAVLTVPYTYKVLYDEFVLQATAWCLHEAHEVGATVRAYAVEGVFSSLQTYLDKRPFFFAFLVSLLHDLTGYREGNIFWFNTVLMPVAIGLVYLLGRRITNHACALAAAVVFGAQPLLAENAMGAGMEMCNMVMLLLVMLLALHYLKEPGEARLSALVLGTVLLAQTRYESSLYVLPAALIIIEGWRRAQRLILPAAAVLAPALLIPYALHNTYLSGTPMLWELREGETARFGGHYLADNLVHAGRFFFGFDGTLLDSWWLGVAGLPVVGWALVMMVRGLRRWRTARSEYVVLTLFGGAITANLVLLMFYYWGQLDDPIVSRLSLPFSALLALCIAWALTRVTPAWFRMAWRVAAGGAMLGYFSTGLMANASHWELNLQAREIAWEVGYVKSRQPESCLVVTNKSALVWIVDHIPAVQTIRARGRESGILYHLRAHTFQNVYVMQKLRPTSAEGDYQIDPADRLPDSFKLEPLIERRFGTSLARISRVKAIEVKANADKVVEKPGQTS